MSAIEFEKQEQGYAIGQVDAYIQMLQDNYTTMQTDLGEMEARLKLIEGEKNTLESVIGVLEKELEEYENGDAAPAGEYSSQEYARLKEEAQEAADLREQAKADAKKIQVLEDELKELRENPAEGAGAWKGGAEQLNSIFAHAQKEADEYVTRVHAAMDEEQRKLKADREALEAERATLMYDARAEAERILAEAEETRRKTKEEYDTLEERFQSDQKAEEERLKKEREAEYAEMQKKAEEMLAGAKAEAGQIMRMLDLKLALAEEIDNLTISRQFVRNERMHSGLQQGSDGIRERLFNAESRIEEMIEGFRARTGFVEPKEEPDPPKRRHRKNL